MGFYDEQVVPRCVHWTLGLPRLRPLRQRAAAGLEGRVLELGFGSGLNLFAYPEGVREVLALEPSAVARRLARKRLHQSRLPVRYVGLAGERIALPDESVDAVLSTWTLCTIPEVERALAEVRRVLRPGGSFHFLEHGLSPEPRVRSWQRRLTPLQARLAGGCRLDREIGTLVSGSGLAIAALEQFAISAPRFLGWHYAGRAEKC